MSKTFWVLGGGNGSGKSEYFRLFLETRGLEFVNADNLAKSWNIEITDEVSKKARIATAAKCQENLKAGKTFCFETVFSHLSKVELIQQAKELGYYVNLVFIHIDNVEKNKARVLGRVLENGHDVAPETIERRIPNSLKNVKLILKTADEIHLVDNSLSGNGAFKTVAEIKSGKVIFQSPEIPDWAKEVLKDL